LDETTKWLKRIFFVGLFALIFAVAMGASFWRQKSTTEQRLDNLERFDKIQAQIDQVLSAGEGVKLPEFPK
jgi:hypothetical protein